MKRLKGLRIFKFFYEQLLCNSICVLMNNATMIKQFNTPVPELAMGGWKGKFL